MILSVMVMSIGYEDGSEDDKDNNDEGMGYKMLIGQPLTHFLLYFRRYIASATDSQNNFHTKIMFFLRQ